MRFDFWIGVWDVSDPQGGRGRNRLRRILGGKVIEETFTFTAADGSTLDGRSHTVEVPGRGWCQTWVDDQGGYLDFTEGTSGQGEVVLERPGQRMVFSDITGDSFRWDWQRAIDSGWETTWRLDYLRSGGAGEV